MVAGGAMRAAVCAVLAAWPAMVQAQAASMRGPAVPTAYSVSGIVNKTPEVNETIIRLGAKVLVDATNEHRVGGRSYTLYDFQTKVKLTWSSADPAKCERTAFDPSSDDWHDPFGGASHLAAPEVRQVGKAKVDGYQTVILEPGNDGSFPVRAWVDPRTGLIVKVVLGSPSDRDARTIWEVTDVNLNEPPASVFEVPANCTDAKFPQRARFPD